MLRTLYIRDYALIDELDVGFDRGLNIITGETGAGKSILVGALKMITGERASTEVVRSGARKAVIEGAFDGALTERVRSLLLENGIEPQEELILRREISETQSRAFINDTPATAQVLRTIAAQLIDLHGQHEHQSLLRVDTHIGLLDNFGALGDWIDAYQVLFREMETLVRRRGDLVRREVELRQQRDLIAFQIADIDAVAPRAGEEDDLEAERRVLEHAEQLFEATGKIYGALYESEQAVYDRLVEVRNLLQELVRIDARFEDAFSEVRSAEIAVQEVSQFVQDYNGRIEFNPHRLEEIRDRLGRLHYLKLKYGGSMEAVLAHREDIGRTFELAADFEGAIQRVSGEIEAARSRLSEAARHLTERRREVAEGIRKAIVRELGDLGIPHAAFDVRFAHRVSENGWVDLADGAERALRVEAGPGGIDEVEFYISTNLGEEPRPLAKVASGGEISRIMLALKTILARNERLPILVFDEIDVGISGAIAQRVGEAMRDLGDTHQVLAITHLPQIAAQGNLHFVVEKLVDSGRTRTHIRRLSEAEREQEVAILLSGTEVTPAAIEGARALIEAGRRPGRTPDASSSSGKPV